MTMYVRALAASTFSFSADDGSEFHLDQRVAYKTLPLWVALLPGFGRVWVDEQVQVATDTSFTQIITSVPSSEISDPGQGQPVSANLTAIAGVTSAADKLPYFTGSGMAAVTTFTTAGRALVDDADAAAQRATLGLGTVFDSAVYATVTALRAATVSTGGFARVQGYYSAGDGGGGFFRWDSTDITSTDNGGTIITPTSGLSSSGRWKRVYEGDPLDVLWFGAAGDGTTNDQAAMQAAITAAPVGSTVYFPEGAYKFNTVIAVSKSLRLLGGPGAVLKPGADTYLNISSTSDVVVDGLKFAGNRSSLGPGSNAVIYLTDVSRVRIRNCRFDNTISTGLSITRGDSVWITGNHFSDTYYSSIRLEDPTATHFNQHIWICDNYFDHCHSAGAGGGHAPIQTDGTTAGSQRYLHVVGNVINLPEGVGIGLDSLDQSHVTGNTIIKDNTCDSGECIAFTGSENVIADNYCHNDATSSAAGILLWAVASRSNDHNQIVNNRCTVGGQGIAFVWGSTGAGINDLLIQGNHCYGNNRGIQSYVGGGVASGSQSNVLIRDNDLTGNTTAPIEVIKNSGGVTGEPVVGENFGAWHSVRSDVRVSPSSATPTINTDIVDTVVFYGQTVAITSMSANLTGTPGEGDRLTLRFQDDGTAHAITWGSMFTGHLLSTTISFKTHTQELIYSPAYGKWLGTFVDTAGI